MKIAVVLGLLIPASSFASANIRPDSNVLEPAKCLAKAIATQITTEFEKDKNLTGYKIKSVADSTLGRAHKFERLPVLVERSGVTSLAEIEFDSSTCKVGQMVQILDFHPVNLQ